MKRWSRRMAFKSLKPTSIRTVDKLKKWRKCFSCIPSQLLKIRGGFLTMGVMPNLDILVGTFITGSITKYSHQLESDCQYNFDPGSHLHICKSLAFTMGPHCSLYGPWMSSPLFHLSLFPFLHHTVSFSNWSISKGKSVCQAKFFWLIYCFLVSPLYHRSLVGQNKIIYSSSFTGYTGGSAGKESSCNAGDLGSIPGLGRSPGEGKGYPLQNSDLENSVDCIVHGVSKSQTQLNDFHFTSLPLLIFSIE